MTVKGVLNGTCSNLSGDGVDDAKKSSNPLLTQEANQSLMLGNSSVTKNFTFENLDPWYLR